MNDLDTLITKVVDTIRRDVDNIFVKASGASVLPPEHQDALNKYYKTLTDAKLAARERELEEKIARAEAAISGGTVSTPRSGQ